MTKICFIVNTIINAGPVNVIYDIVSNIDRNVFEPIIWALDTAAHLQYSHCIASSGGKGGKTKNDIGYSCQ